MGGFGETCKLLFYNSIGAISRRTKIGCFGGRSTAMKHAYGFDGF